MQQTKVHLSARVQSTDEGASGILSSDDNIHISVLGRCPAAVRKSLRLSATIQDGQLVVSVFELRGEVELYLGSTSDAPIEPGTSDWTGQVQ